MNLATLTRNGSSPHGSAPIGSTKNWLQSSVQEFFSRINWEDAPLEVQELKLHALQGSDTPLSLTLSVSQFFAAIPWEGTPIAPQTGNQVESESTENAFTLDDFSNLF